MRKGDQNWNSPTKAAFPSIQGWIQAVKDAFKTSSKAANAFFFASVASFLPSLHHGDGGSGNRPGAESKGNSADVAAAAAVLTHFMNTSEFVTSA